MFVQPSSLIFLVIIGIWAAYFVQYWVRRREHLATIRSVDAFSETMRVLERRAPLPSVDQGAQAPRTYAVSPARAMRPQVTVKRAEAHAVAAHTAVSAPAARVAAEVEGNDMSEPILPSMNPGRATRGIVVLVGLVGTVVFGLLSVVGVLVSWSFIVPLAMAGAGFAWLRAGIQAEIKAKRAARGRARRAAARTTAPRATATRTTAPTQRVSVPAATTAPGSSDDAVATESVDEPVVASAPFDVSADVAVSTFAAPAAEQPLELEPVAMVEHEVALPELDEDDIPLTWDPRPVPRPTYTMKARAAERPAPAAQAEPEAEAEQPAYDDLPQRRIVGG